MADANSGAIFVLPSTTSGQQGPVASWVSTAGWARAARRVLGEVWIATPAGLVDPDEARRRASHPRLSTVATPSWRRRLPTPAKIAAKDLRQFRRARHFTVNPDGPWRDHDIRFVWQRHDLFQTAGLQLARSLQVPSVVFVPATLVWESAQWEVRRPGWATWLERFGEAPALRGADLVACGSDVVAEQVHRLGVKDERILITPTGVDLNLFEPKPGPSAIRDELGLRERFVVGWVGSFRRFHALEQAVDAVARMENAVLLMVGDGPERARIRRLARDRGVTAKFTGTVPHAELPDYLAAMDVALVLASPGQVFHYSPLKLAEYLAAGLPVVAPRVAQLADRLTDDVDAMLVPPGDAQALAVSLQQLQDDVVLRERLAKSARASAEARWSWDHEVRRILASLG
jgi:glycosyltransferase involved in cell wall biosynthesis